MVKFITRTVCMALISALCMGVSAQNTPDEMKRAKYEQLREIKQAAMQQGTPIGVSAVAKASREPVRGLFVEDVESHMNFTINSTVNGWSHIDVDGSITWGIQNCTFPGAYEPMVCIVFNPSATTPPLSNADPHSGSKYFAFFDACLPPDGGTGPNDDWLISPLLSEPTKLSFWAKSYTETYGLERMQVGYSKTGTAQSDFTFFTASYISVPATAWTEYEYDLPEGTKYIVIRCVSSDAFFLMVDDISIQQGEAQPCPAVTNLQTEIQGTDVKLTWTAATGTPTGYKVYNGSTSLATVTTTQYVFKNLAAGTHTLGVEAIYDDGCTPERVTKTIEIPVALNPVKNLDGNCTDGTLTLNWTKPDDNGTGFNDWMTYLAGDYAGGIGVSNPLNCMFANRWSPADLAAKGITTGAKLTKITQFFNTQFNEGKIIEVASYIIKVWQGSSSTSAGTEVYSSATFNYPGQMVDYEWNEHTLTTPIEIDASLELWIGVHVNMTVGTGAPVPYCTGGFVTDVNMMRFNNVWNPIEKIITTPSPFSSGNWALKGFVIAEGGDPIEVTHYNVYRDADKIGEVAVPTTTFTKTGMPEEINNYGVVAVYDNGAQSPKVWKNNINCGPEPCNKVTGPSAKVSCAAELAWNVQPSAKEYRILDKNNDLVGIAETNSYTIEGDYVVGTSYEWRIVTVCTDGGVSDAVAVTAVATDCVSINEHTINVAIFPNPANSTVNIQMANFEKVEVYNTVGQLIETKTVSTVDVSSYNVGVYFFKVYDTNNNSVTKRVMVAK